MARNCIDVDVPPDRVFEVLADARSYAYWVLGSRVIRAADAEWPAPGSAFDHKVGVGPIRIKDSSVVEECEPPRLLKLKAKAGPFGNARVTLELEPHGGGTRVTMTEDPADAVTAFVFTPLTHLLMRGRNERSLQRLKELAEGEVEIPGGPLPARGHEGAPGTAPAVNPTIREGRSAGTMPEDSAGFTDRVVQDVARGVVAGVAGTVLMSLSTNAEMRLRGRPPSRVPAKALKRLPGVEARGRKAEQRLVTIGHVLGGTALGGVRGALHSAGLGPGPATGAFFAISAMPDFVVLPALGHAEPPWRWSAADITISALHHGVYALGTSVVYERISR